MAGEGQTLDQEIALQSIIKAEKERYERQAKLYLLDVLKYLAPAGYEEVKGKKISCSELVNYMRLAVVQRNAEFQAVSRELSKAKGKLASIAQVDCFEGCSFAPSPYTRGKKSRGA